MIKKNIMKTNHNEQTIVLCTPPSKNSCQHWKNWNMKYVKNFRFIQGIAFLSGHDDGPEFYFIG